MNRYSIVVRRPAWGAVAFGGSWSDTRRYSDDFGRSAPSCQGDRLAARGRQPTTLDTRPAHRSALPVPAFHAVEQHDIAEGSVIVIRYEGPKGGPGMREMLSTTAALYGQGMGD